MAQLHEVHIPETWTAVTAENFVYRLAAECGVTKEWIVQWSSFRYPDPYFIHRTWKKITKLVRGPDSLVNYCVPGGICLVITTGCNEKAFGGLDHATGPQED